LRVVLAIPEAHVKAPVLDGALEAVTRLNESLIKAGASPTSDQLIDAGAKWRPEKPGDEHFDHGGLIAKRGHGDCDDWAPLHAATLRVTGEDPGAKAIVRKSGEKRWHAIVQRSDGSIDDPSLDAGMPGPRVVGMRGAVIPTMFRPERVHGVGGSVGSFIAKPHLALRPVADRHGQVESWQARADLPWHWHPSGSPSDAAMVSLHQSPVSDQAVVGAVRGAFRLGLVNGADPEHLKRLSAIADACEGYSWEEIAGCYGPEHANAAGQIVGSFFGKLGKGLKGLAKGALKIASPLAKGALSFVPGGGLASSALSMASRGLQKSVAQKKHLPPQQRAAALRAAPPPRAPAPRAPAPPQGFAGMPQFLPYPYPLPYPVPGWSGAPETIQPGLAWPPRK